MSPTSALPASIRTSATRATSPKLPSGWRRKPSPPGHDKLPVTGRRQAGHRPRPPAARPEYRQGGAGDAQFRADRDAAGRAAGRLAQPRGRTGRERRRRGPGTGPGFRHRCRRRLPTAPRSSPRPSADATSSCRSLDPRNGDADRQLTPSRAAILFGAERSGLETDDVALANRSSPCRSTRNSARSTSPRR